MNFRKENQTTKGKRWDRTMYAETGRRVSAGKGKSKANGRGGKNMGRRTMFDDDVEEGDEQEEEEAEEDGWGGPLVPGPKPLVDPSESGVPQLADPQSCGLG